MAAIDDNFPERMPQQEVIAALLKLRTPFTENFRHLAELSLQVAQLRTAIEHPTGTITDYRRTVSDKQQQVMELLKRLNNTRPDVDTVQDSIAAVATFELYRAPSET